MKIGVGQPMVFEPIGVINSCYREKFGIPRQPGMVEMATATIELSSPYNRLEMVKELEQFSHIWVVFLFHDSLADGWKATVRPPGLGGQQRVGIFASRSPHRPNHIGLSAVRLIKIFSARKKLCLDIGGGDFLDQTPVLDVKPYLPYSDCIQKACGGYAGRRSTELRITFTENVAQFCGDYQRKTGRDLQALVHQILLQDPRPASQRDKKSDFGMRLWDVNIRWRTKENQFVVFSIRNYEGS